MDRESEKTISFVGRSVDSLARQFFMVENDEAVQIAFRRIAKKLAGKVLPCAQVAFIVDDCLLRHYAYKIGRQGDRETAVRFSQDTSRRIVDDLLSNDDKALEVGREVLCHLHAPLNSHKPNGMAYATR